MRSRLPVAIVIYSLMTATFANNALSTIYVIYETRFRFSSLSVTAIFATYAVAVLVALLSVGRLSDDIGRKPLLIAGSVLLILSTVLFLVATGTVFLFLGRAVMGLATGALTAAGAAALVDLEPNRDRQRASLQTTLGFLTGAAFGPLLFGVVAQYLPKPTFTPFIIEIVLQAVALVGVMTLHEPATHQLTKMTWRLQRPSVPPEIRRQFALAGLVVTIGWMMGGIYGSLSGSLDRQLLHVSSHAIAGAVLFVFASIGGAAQFLFRVRPARTAMIAGVIAAVVGIIVVEAALIEASAPLFLVGTLATGIGNGLCFIGSLSLVNEIAVAAMRAELVAAYNVVAYFAISLPVVGVGVLANLFGLKTATLLFAAVIVALAAGTLVTLVKSPTPAPRSIVVSLEARESQSLSGAPRGRRK